MSDDDDSDKEGDKDQNDRDVIERELFDGEEGEEEPQPEEERQVPDTLQEDLAGSGEESGEFVQFFVVINGSMAAQNHEKKGIIL